MDSVVSQLELDLKSTELILLQSIQDSLHQMGVVSRLHLLKQSVINSSGRLLIDKGYGSSMPEVTLGLLLIKVL